MKIDLRGDGGPESGDEHVRALLTQALGDTLTPTRMSWAEAMYAVFLSEVRQQGRDVTARSWRALDVAAVRRLASKLEASVWQGNLADLELPAGTVLMDCVTGCVIIGDETVGFDVDRPGLHDMDDLPCVAAGSNLTLLLAKIDALSRDLPCRSIGLPMLVERHDGRHLSHRLQFPSHPGAGNVMLERKLDYCTWGEFFCAFPEERVSELAEEIVIDMGILWKCARVITPRVRRAWAAASRAVAGLRGVQVQGVALEFDQSWLDRRFPLEVEFACWDHSLRRGVLARTIGPNAEPEKANFELVDRTEEVAQIRALGADGRIEGVARAIAMAAPGGFQQVVDELGKNYETYVTLPGSPLRHRFRLRWWDGVIRAENSTYDRLSAGDGQVTIRDHSIPISIALELPGLPLHSVFDGPFRADTPIRSVTNEGGNVRIELEEDLWLIDCANGRTWRE